MALQSLMVSINTQNGKAYLNIPVDVDAHKLTS